MDNEFAWLALIMGYLAAALIGGFGFYVLVGIHKGKIDLSNLIGEPDGSGASLSRFQFLVFSLVIALSLLYVTLKSGEFPTIDGGIFALLGISGGSYVVSKSLHKSKSTEENPPANPKPDGEGA